MDKRERELRKFLKKIDCELLGYTGSTHRRIRCKRTGKEVTASLSPRNVENYLNAIRRQVRRIRKGVYDAPA